MKTQLVRFFLKIISATLIKAELYLEILLVNMHVVTAEKKPIKC
jgi:homoserine dehydrogenase